MKALSTVLIIAGILMMVITGFNLVSKEKVVDLGPLEVNKEKSTPVSWSPIVGAVLLISGVAIAVSQRRHA